MSARKRGRSLTKAQEEFAAWLLLDKRTRKLHGLPSSQVEWSQWKGFDSEGRTVRRWKSKPEFQAYLEHLRLQRARELTPNSTVTAEMVGGPAVPHEQLEPPAPATDADDPLSRVDDPRYRDYLIAREAMLDAVREGERGAAADFIKLFGREYLEAEQAGTERLVEMSDEELVREVIRLLGLEAVSGALAELMAR